MKSTCERSQFMPRMVQPGFWSRVARPRPPRDYFSRLAGRAWKWVRNGVHDFTRSIAKRQGISLISTPVAAGFPSPAQDYIEGRLDIDQLLVEHRESTFFWRVQGCSMDGVGIHDGDLLVVDRALTPGDGSVVIAILDGGFAVKQLIRRQGRVILRSAHPNYPDIFVAEEQDLTIWGVVRWAVHRVTGRPLR